MESYRRVNSSRTAASSCKENEIRITTQGLSGGYISYAMSLFQDNYVSEVVLTAMGRAINKAVMLAEILKRRIEGLHQNISLSSSYVKDVWEPLEEGLETLEMVRHVSMISIILSTKELDVSSSGYQAPAFTNQVQPLAEANHEGGFRGAGRSHVRGRGFERRNMRAGNGYYNCGDENWNPGRGEYRGRDRGYDAGGRGYNKGYSQAHNRGYNNPYSQGDNRGYNSAYSQGDSRGYNNAYSQGDRRGQSNYYPQAVKSHPQADMRGYNKGYSQADNRAYNHASHSQGDKRGQNNYYPPAVIRKYNGGNSQANVRGHNQPQADARGYSRPRRVLHQYNNGYPLGGHDNSAGDQDMSFQGRGRGGIGGRGRGRGRFG